MTRKKSNVKALALAVTCAILAGGYSGLNPVYAADDNVTYDNAGSTLKYEVSGAKEEIKQLKINGVYIGTNTTTSTAAAGRIEAINIRVGEYLHVGKQLKASTIVGTTTGGTVEVNGVKFASGAAITASSLSLGTMSDVAAVINSKAAQEAVNTNKAAIEKLKIDKADAANVYTKTDSDSKFAGKTYEGKVDTLETTVGDASAGLVKKVGDNETAIANNRADIVALNGKTQDITRESNGSTTVDGVNFNGGAVTGVTSINDTQVGGVTLSGGTIEAASGKFKVYNNGAIEAAGGAFKVGSSGTINALGIQTHSNGSVTLNDKLFLNAADASLQDKATGDAVSVSDMAKTKYNTDNITYDAATKTTYINKGTDQQVVIDEKGLKVGKNSSRMNDITGFATSKDLYVGTADADAPTKDNSKFYVDGNDGSLKAADGKFTVNGANGDISTDGSVTAKGGLSAANNAFKVDGTNGDISTDGNLVVKQKITGQSLNIGATGTEFTVDTVGNVTANGITTNDTTTNKIGGVTLAGSDINAKNLTLTGTLTAAKYNATDIEATNSIKVGATIMTNGKLDLGSNGTVDFGVNELTDVQVGNINNVIQTGGIVKAADGSVIGGVSFSAKDITGVKDLTATGTVTAATISDGTASLSGGALTGLASVNIGGNTTINSTGIETNKLIVGSGLNATTIDDTNGVVSAKGEIGAVRFSGSGKLDNVTAIDGVSVAQNSGTSAGGLTFGGNAIIGATGIPFQSTGFKVDDDGDVEGKTFTTAADGTGNRSTLASGQLTIDPKNTWTKDNGIIASNVKVGTNELKDDGLHVGTNTLVKDGEITVGTGNSWSMANGIAATKAAINGVTIGETAGKAVFNNAGKSTTIDGDTIQTGKITADELLIDKISLGKGGSSNITIDKDGHVQTKGDIKITDAAGNVMSKLSQDQATFGKDAANQTNINNGKLKAKAKNTANQQAEFNFDENGLTVSGLNAAGATSSFGFNAANGIGTFTGQDGTTTAINGSSITSTNGGATGVLNGSSLTLDDGTNSTALNAGGATFTGAAGEKGGKVTTINGGTITTDTLNVERINLGGELYDKNGTAIGGNLSMDKDGNFSAAGGNFKVKGGTGTDRGALHNKVGNTYFDTTETGASMKFDTTTPTGGGVKSEVSVADNSAKISAGASSIEVKSDGITNTGKTTFTGATGRSDATDPTVIKNQTTIDGGIITTDTLNVQRIELGDKLVDKNGTAFGSNLSMDNQGNFSAAGGNFKVNGADGAMTNTVGNATFETKADSIGGVVTNGTVKMKQELTAEGVKVTDELGDPANYTQITDKDVSITDPKNAGKRINLSDLGQLNDLDGELAARDEYQDNKTAVGAINAEAGIRREEVARLDNRIDDVNNRVDKVGAMAAAIASLKSIGYDPQAPSEFSIGLGQYKGETGVAMGFFHYPNKNFMINVSLSTAGGETMGGIGATWRFGHKSPQKLLDEQREAQARKELAAAEKYQAAAKLAKEAQERAEYAAKLARQAQVSADNAKAAADATQAKHFQ